MAKKIKVVINNSSGKKQGKVYEIDESGNETELLKLKAPTFTHLSRELRNSGLLPPAAVINKRGETLFL